MPSENVQAVFSSAEHRKREQDCAELEIRESTEPTDQPVHSRLMDLLKNPPRAHSPQLKHELSEEVCGSNVNGNSTCGSDSHSSDCTNCTETFAYQSAFGVLAKNTPRTHTWRYQAPAKVENKKKRKRGRPSRKRQSKSKLENLLCQPAMFGHQAGPLMASDCYTIQHMQLQPPPTLSAVDASVAPMPAEENHVAANESYRGKNIVDRSTGESSSSTTTSQTNHATKKRDASSNDRSLAKVAGLLSGGSTPSSPQSSAPQLLSYPPNSLSRPEGLAAIGPTVPAHALCMPPFAVAPTFSPACPISSINVEHVPINYYLGSTPATVQYPAMQSIAVPTFPPSGIVYMSPYTAPERFAHF